jgi:hypothetical protein
MAVQLFINQMYKGFAKAVRQLNFTYLLKVIEVDEQGKEVKEVYEAQMTLRLRASRSSVGPPHDLG